MGAFRDRSKGVVEIRKCQTSFIDYVVRPFAVSFRDYASYIETDGGSGEYVGGAAPDVTSSDCDSSEGESESGGTDTHGVTHSLSSLLDSMVGVMEQNKELWCSIEAEDADIIACLDLSV
ncbi:hypothetical protein KIPB_002718 [Kipferlia bialata]|uniref:Uncharacterized protein n=1 Tax=Kipferlia bialata TaxID=797122 RepID=A0A391NMK0_9EUKA|nr:hypothetical protein KIPB_002718 [Kipferlia bialata]|eukprot:g2718.t1